MPLLLLSPFACSIPTTLPATLTVGGHQPLNNFGDLLREEISRAGYTEMLTHGLCSRDENFKVRIQYANLISGPTKCRDRVKMPLSCACFKFGCSVHGDKHLCTSRSVRSM